MKALGSTMARRGLGYITALTLTVMSAGAAGMLYFERQSPSGGLNDFWTALWWTAMILTTMGSKYWPKTAEGRALCLFLAVYTFTVFGYFTVAIASYFVDRDADKENLVDRETIEKLRSKTNALRDELQRLREIRLD